MLSNSECPNGGMMSWTCHRDLTHMEHFRILGEEERSVNRNDLQVAGDPRSMQYLVSKIQDTLLNLNSK